MFFSIEHAGTRKFTTACRPQELLWQSRGQVLHSWEMNSQVSRSISGETTHIWLDAPWCKFATSMTSVVQWVTHSPRVMWNSVSDQCTMPCRAAINWCRTCAWQSWMELMALPYHDLLPGIDGYPTIYGHKFIKAFERERECNLRNRVRLWQIYHKVNCIWLLTICRCTHVTLLVFAMNFESLRCICGKTCKTSWPDRSITHVYLRPRSLEEI